MKIRNKRELQQIAFNQTLLPTFSLKTSEILGNYSVWCLSKFYPNRQLFSKLVKTLLVSPQLMLFYNILSGHYALALESEIFARIFSKSSGFYYNYKGTLPYISLKIQMLK